MRQWKWLSERSDHGTFRNEPDGFFVYALRDPRTMQVRWIGQTTRRARFTFPSQIRKGANWNQGKDAWLDQLEALDMRPVAEVLESIHDKADLLDAERFWICQALGLGWPILNISKGHGDRPIRFTQSNVTTTS